jgi:hypothetical protein
MQNGLPGLRDNPYEFRLRSLASAPYFAQLTEEVNVRPF